jgi:hypothetical protein
LAGHSGRSRRTDRLRPNLFGGDICLFFLAATFFARAALTRRHFLQGVIFAMRDSVSRRQNATPRRAQRSAIPSSRLWIESLRQKRRAE